MEGNVICLAHIFMFINSFFLESLRAKLIQGLGLESMIAVMTIVGKHSEIQNLYID